MKRVCFCLCALMLLTFGISALAATEAVEQRVVDLPADQNKLYVSVVGDTTDVRYQRVLGWFTTNSILKSIKDQTHFNAVVTGTPTYRDRYQPNTKTLPMVRLQNTDGVVLLEVAGADLTSDKALSARFTECLSRPWLPWRKHHGAPDNCPKPEPQPNPQPQPNPEPQPNSQPQPDEPSDVGPVPSDLPPGWLLLLVAVLAGGLAVASWGHENFHDKKVS